jgi:hypothetical protein
LIQLCDRLQREHGANWETRWSDAVLDARGNGETWTRELLQQILTPMLDTVERAESVGGSPDIALTHAHGLDARASNFLMGLVNEARSTTDTGS